MALASTLVAALIGAGVITVILLFSGGHCAASTVIITEPIDALLSVPWPNERVFGPNVIAHPPCFLEDWPSIWSTWLRLWGPICIVLVVIGYIAARFGGSISLVRGAMAAAIAVIIPLIVELNRMLATGQFDHALALKWVLAILGLAAGAAALGMVGAIVARRHA